MLVPSTAVESMGLGGLLGAAAMRQQALSQDPAGIGTRQWTGGLNHTVGDQRQGDRPGGHRGAPGRRVKKT